MPAALFFLEVCVVWLRRNFRISHRRMTKSRAQSSRCIYFDDDVERALHVSDAFLSGRARNHEFRDGALIRNENNNCV